jgi:1-acyl-sn-glycerol-3-phosphate acyltransferase
VARTAWRFLRGASRVVVRRQLDLTVEGAELVPRSGPAIIAARHFHHLHDGCALIAAIDRPLHIVVALDWVRSPAARIAMDAACRGARWPVVLRQDGAAPVDRGDAIHELRKAIEDCTRILRDGQLLLIFPEGYPNVDPAATPKPDLDAWLHFRPGVVRLATLAAMNGMRVPIIPAGLAYEKGDRWRVALRFGAPVFVDGRAGETAALQEIEDQVRRLSAAR